jgi:hypothetical protein
MQSTPGYLINSVTIDTPTTGPFLLKAGSLVNDPVTLAAVIGAGGMLGNTTDPIILAAVAVVQKMRSKRGQDEHLCDQIMQAAYAETVGQGEFITTPFAAGSGASDAEALVGGLTGSGIVTGAVYINSGATYAPAAGSNSELFQLNMYNAAGTLVGALGSMTVNNANPLVKWVGFPFGSIANAAFQAGYFVTFLTTVTGTFTRPAGQLVVYGVR